MPRYGNDEPEAVTGQCVSRDSEHVIWPQPGRIRTEAAFAALCGVSTVDCSSGKQDRHRLNHGADRKANRVEYTLAGTAVLLHRLGWSVQA
jgi:transposase